MATLYEIDTEILNCIDQETGEILDAEKLEALQIQREEKIEAIALWYKNLMSDAEAYKVEKEIFAEREKAAKAKAESLKKWLTEALAGEKMTTSKVLISFRKSEAVEVEDEEKFIEWAQRARRKELLTFKLPAINKTAIKAVLASGKKLKGVNIVARQNIQIK